MKNAGTMPHEVKEMLGLPSKDKKRSPSGSPGSQRKDGSLRSIKFGGLTPRRLEKFDQHFKRRAKIKMSSQRVQVRSPEQKCSHGGQIKKPGKLEEKNYAINQSS